MIQILHITIDDKFIESANRQFERIYPGCNKFYFLVGNKMDKLRFITKQPHFEIVEQNHHTLTKILNEINNYDLVVFHGLDDFRCQIVKHAGKNVKILWSFWGYEIYNFKQYYTRSIYGERTLKRFKHIIRKKSGSWHIRQKRNFESQLRKFNRFRAIKKIRFFAFPFKEEYEFLNKLKILNSRYVRFTYYPLEHIVRDHVSTFVSGTGILVGNSATPSNNHLEVFLKLKDLPVGNRKIIVPLSYGINEYRDEILKLKNEFFPENMEPLTDFYNLQDYNKIINSCSVFIMNSYRQQGIGNTFAMLWMGARVYLDERNTTYSYLKRINCSVFSITQDLVPGNASVFEPLDKADLERNREILRNELGEDFLTEELKRQLNEIIGYREG